MSKGTSFLYQLARTANDSADVSVSCAFKFDEWKKFVQGRRRGVSTCAGKGKLGDGSVGDQR